MLVVNPDTPSHDTWALVPKPDPEPGAREVIVDVAAAGVNRADLLQVAGSYPPPPGAPSWPGLEVSGTVSAVGPGSRWQVGDEVVALVEGGGYATRVLVPDAQVLPAPHGVPLVDAAALPEAVCTLWSTLGAARLTAGEWLLVHGGSGGIGTVAIQLATAMGVHVATTAGGPDRTARCAELGAELAIDHRSADLASEVHRVAPDGVDVILDVLGAGSLATNLSCLAVEGRLAIIGLQQGSRAELDLGLLLSRRLTVLATTLRSRPRTQKAEIVAGVAEHVWPLVESGQVRPVVHDRVPLAEAAHAHRRLASGEVFGSLVLVP
ncbi:NAD(P)H-quinone oxidoreductase [Isoptericola sp. b441]|uniref:NAD(P)H-quinone oxidoreductase n=1 Tax=Actinotalea lenta TaxID=3064654 RepID=A0ABT9D647_9CELL|nr:MULTISPECIES: NAD(P)H-quinone oxidoreductase [unclassified Isoptericola]MDO8105970.1 NAD(P)H-quinone oxidoreductase [Isoptericola sp. b441]MDO8122311.1 NAD(P)H-quinone oxidoreductase [Isoptericola sp. b490]